MPPSPSPSPAPTCVNDADCDDGAFCNGSETCAAGVCEPGDPPCDPETETCDEDSGSCDLIVPECLSRSDCAPLEECVDDRCVPISEAVCGEGAGNCYIANFTAGCEMVSCCDIVCQFEPFCCFQAWDENCAEMALSFCPLEP